MIVLLNNMYLMINGLSRQNSNTHYVHVATILFLCALVAGTSYFAGRAVAMEKINETIELTAPGQDSETSVELALRERRSVREFRREPITLAQLSQLLWAAQGITDSRGYRTAPSAGALYPLEIYVMVGNVKDLPVGLYKYQPDGHRLLRMASDDRRKQMKRAAMGQNWVSENAALFVFSSVDSRTTRKYGRRGIRYIHIEVGHAAQNVMLQARTLELGAAVVGAFDDNYVNEILDLPENERSLYLMPIGKPR
jgi:SagB-type dehydrogenase family enzyme